MQGLIEVLFAAQAGCQHASDVLRPYSALDYAWDEPGLPHTLLLELPGSCSLGQFQLDKVRTFKPPRSCMCHCCPRVLHVCCLTGRACTANPSAAKCVQGIILCACTCRLSGLRLTIQIVTEQLEG